MLVGKKERESKDRWGGEGGGVLPFLFPLKIFIRTECHWSFGRSNHFRKATFSCVVFAPGASKQKNEAGEGGEKKGEISYLRRERNGLTYLLQIWGSVSAK